MNILDLEILKEGFNYIDEAYGALMCKSAIVAFESQGYSSEVVLKVNTVSCTEFEKDARREDINVNFTTFKVLWATKIDKLTLRSYRDENRTTDFGAMAVALLLTLQLTDYDTILFTEGFNGIDFWLGYKKDGLDFKARLEVSGIRKTTIGNTVRHRVKLKIEQSKKSDSSTLPVYIAVTAFSLPSTVFCKRTL